MNKWTIAAAALAVAATVGVSAQSGGNIGMNDKTDQTMGKMMTHTGCVAAGAQSGTFMLTHMDMKNGKTGKDTMPEAPMLSSMMLMGTKVDFSKHVGHTVSVTGMMDPEAMKKIGGMAKTDTMSKSGTMPSTGMMVASIKMMGTSCAM